MENEVELNEAQKNYAEMAVHFAALEKFSQKDPTGFAFFFKKYEKLFWENFDWAYALFHGLDVKKGIIESFLPYVSAGLSLMTLGLLIFILAKL